MKTIKLTQDKVALIDNEDFKLINQYKWYACKCGNAYYTRRKVRDQRTEKIKTIYMHRFIMNVVNSNVEVDGDTLDNRKRNLRTRTVSENRRNQKKTRGNSKFKGVCWSNRDNKWYAYIKVNRQKIHLGVFNDESEAAKTYNIAAQQYFGKFSRLNAIER